MKKFKVNEKDIRNITRNLRALRDDQWASVADLSEYLHLPIEVIRKIESGDWENVFYVFHLFQLADYYSIHPTEFFLDAEEFDKRHRYMI